MPRTPLNPAMHPTRRTFLTTMAALGAASAVPSTPLHASTASPHIRNRAPLTSAAFTFLPLGSIRPQGWLLDQLRIQAAGLTGHLDETWPDVGPNSGWLGGSGESWERGPYYLDGLVPLAWALDDAHLKAKAQKYIDWVLDHPAPNGSIGPTSNNDWWPRFVILKVLTQYHELTTTDNKPDPRVIPLLDKYFRYQLGELPTRPLRDWGKFRWQDEVLTVLWLYNRTGSPYLLDLARLLHKQGFDWQAQFADFKYTQRITADFLKLNQDQGLADLALSTHGVNNGQAIKTGPVWSQVSGSSTDRSAATQMIAALDKYHGLPNGMFSCDEHLAGPDPSQGSELCTVVETMFSLEHSLAITGDPALGDRLERLAFNALPGTLTDDMWAHQYNQEPNQVECSLHRKPWTTDGPESNLFGLEPNFGCCTANYHQGWPKFNNSLFLVSSEQNDPASEGLVAAAYAPCQVSTTLRGIPVRLVEETNYPFHGEVHITLHPGSPLAFPLALRIPAWAHGAAITVNGQPQPAPTPGTFARISRTWQPGDRLTLTLPMAPRISRWFNNSVAIERGPLVFSYAIGESWVKLRDRGLTADWQVYPTTPWNYALILDEHAPGNGIETSAHTPVSASAPHPHHATPTLSATAPASPFAARNASIRLQVKARRITEWRAEDGAPNPLPKSPVSTAEPVETLTLIPYAAAKLRITAFPQAKS